ncbi:MAG: PD-(D/E)XK motif protein [Pseudomonadota bacterium]|nr:PD-(D/E)XK motif protein [Pseudomonadota bacterium]
MSDPWSSIEIPASTAANARRADMEHPHDFFWALDTEGHCLFVLEYPKEISISDKKPHLNGIKVIDYASSESSRKKLILSLRQNEHREVFYRLCTDVLEATQNCIDSTSALHVMLRRTWRWHQLLRGERDGRLSPEAQKGLIGEIDCLASIALVHFNPSEALSFWEGPSGSPKDFVIGKTCVEVKARLGSAQPFISITSEHQLDLGRFNDLFLYVLDLSPAARSDEGSFTLNDYVDRTWNLIHSRDPRSVEIFEEKLLALGYQSEDDYSDQYWIRLDSHVYQVHEKFPCIIDSSLPPSVTHVSYRIDLGSIRDYKIELSRLEDRIIGKGSDR